MAENDISKTKVGKNITLKLSNLGVIAQYQNRTKKNFSQTLNIIIEEWDKYSLEVQKLKEKMHLETLRTAKVLKNES
jgi:hypothetical protein